MKEDYAVKSDYGKMMNFVLGYSVSGRNRFDDVVDGLANFRLFIENMYEIRRTQIIRSPI
jgi:hypothetical protein